MGSRMTAPSVICTLGVYCTETVKAAHIVFGFNE